MYLNGKLRWLTIGSIGKIDFDNARAMAAQALLKVATGVDVQAERRAEGREAERPAGRAGDQVRDNC